ncbi:unnamed protein product [Cuscuta campestris]|uniref:Uncharacterized protein n=1 Tax=Cuscuta campestris TaxID=132261 RepID=A0A484KUE5_9ASTE|nr:unnamed protein product [Cuscuta campestris]
MADSRLSLRADIGLGRSGPTQSSTRPAARLYAPLVPPARLRAPLVLLPGSALRSSSCSAQSSTRPPARLRAPLVLLPGSALRSSLLLGSASQAEPEPCDNDVRKATFNKDLVKAIG